MKHVHILQYLFKWSTSLHILCLCCGTRRERLAQIWKIFRVSVRRIRTQAPRVCRWRTLFSRFFFSHEITPAALFIMTLFIRYDPSPWPLEMNKIKGAFTWIVDIPTKAAVIINADKPNLYLLKKQWKQQIWTNGWPHVERRMRLSSFYFKTAVIKSALPCVTSVLRTTSKWNVGSAWYSMSVNAL